MNYRMQGLGAGGLNNIDHQGGTDHSPLDECLCLRVDIRVTPGVGEHPFKMPWRKP